MNEPNIIINGQKLTSGQAMTVRVALGAFAMSLKDGLGDDEHGRRMTTAYQAQLADIFRIMGVVG
jgi:hypothetical protein